MREGLVFDVRRFCLHDGPGLRTTVFFKGCPLRCAWCHNPEGLSFLPGLKIRIERCISCGSCHDVCKNAAVDDASRCVACGACAKACPAQAREAVGYKLSESGLISALVRDEAYFLESGGGVTFSGGEPFAQGDFLLACLESCRREGIGTAVDTSGYADPEYLAAAVQLGPLFLYDLKHLDSAEHKKLTGTGNETILANLKLIASLGADVAVSFPLVPGMNDSIENIEETAGFVSDLGRDYPVRILPYHGKAAGKYERTGLPFAAKEVHEPGTEEIERVVRIFGDSGIKTSIGG